MPRLPPHLAPDYPRRRTGLLSRVPERNLRMATVIEGEVFMDSVTIIKKAMANARGDDLERAEAAFHGMTGPELDQMYGQSGRTRREILEGYRQRRMEWQQANQYLKSLIP